MKTTTKRSIVSLGLLVGAVAAIALFSLGSYPSYRVVSAQEGDSAAHGKQIVGTWRVQVTQRDCNSGAELRTFPALLAFAQGGTLTGATTAFPAALRGSDQGIWTHEGGRNYRAVSEAFLFSPAGAWTLRQRITQAIQLDQGGDSFTSDAEVEFFDMLGNLTSAGCATALATRME